MSAVHSALHPDFKPVCIGRGSFAQVWSFAGTDVAFKEAQRGEEGDDIAREFTMCGEVYAHCQGETFFLVPRAVALSIPSGLGEDAVFKLSALREKTLVTIPTHHAASSSSGPNLCRLYFGKKYGSSRSRFANTHNFPLDCARYEALTAAYPDFQVSPEAIARGIGETLGHIHLCAGYDGRDIEFVLGGDGGGGFSFWVIDFNQMRVWQWASDIHSLADVQPLVDSFFIYDPYYPRPRPSDALYAAFKAGYRSAFYASVLPFADRFLAAIEAEQAAGDN
ncbi:hypothetical protein C8T65DRAFT_706758 [Cerioporus squamosus]|nr:hypothetical protein C8T65DRAFT_706758 [Cerioporus squamosus]